MSELLKEINWNYVWFVYTVLLTIRLEIKRNEVEQLRKGLLK